MSANAGNGETGLAALFRPGESARSSSFPRRQTPTVRRIYRAGEIELEVAPGLVELIRAAGAGYSAVFTPTAYGTMLAVGKEGREINGRHYVLEYPIHADVALIKARQGDRWGNLVYRKTGRNFGPVMAMAAACTVAQVDRVVDVGALDPESIVTPGIFVHRVVAA